MGGYSLVAIGVVNKRKIYFGLNSIKTHPRFVYYKGDVELSSHHAEFDLLKRVPECEIPLLTVYVCRLDKFGKFTLAKPCSYCCDLLIRERVKAVYYTTRTGLWERMF